MDRLSAMMAFARVVEAGSLSAAARALNTSLASVSRQLAALERQLGARLMNRTTRRIALTEGGRAYYERCKRVLADIEEAEAALSQHQAMPSGRLMVSAPIAFGEVYLAPIIAGFLVRHPKVTIDLSLADRFVNVVEEGIDVALRVGTLADSSLIARRLGTFRRVVVASPAYLKSRAAPRRPADIAGHDCLSFSMLIDPVRWHFMADGKEVVVPIAPRLRSDNQLVLRQAAIDGAGLLLASSWFVREPVAAGRLQVVLDEFETPVVPIHAVYPHARLLSAKVRTFVEYLAAAWAGEDFAAVTAARPGSTGDRPRKRRSRS